jgi:hypothetical protein
MWPVLAAVSGSWLHDIVVNLTLWPPGFLTPFDLITPEGRAVKPFIVTLCSAIELNFLDFIEYPLATNSNVEFRTDIMTPRPPLATCSVKLPHIAHISLPYNRE